MLIALLTAAYLLLFNGHETFLLNPELKKNVHVFVKDEHRKKEIDSLIKRQEKSEEKFAKVTRKEYEKKLDQLNLNRASTREQFSQEYDLYYTGLSQLQDNYIAAELKIRSLITAAEWEEIMNKVLQAPEKSKAEKKLLDENKKQHDRLLNQCRKYIRDSASIKQVAALLNEYQQKGEVLDKAFLDLNYKNLAEIRPYGAKKEDFEPTRQKMLNLRRSYTNDLVDLRFRLLALTPAAGWPGLAKDLKEQFNYLGAAASK